MPSAAGDQLVENGLSSPLCEGSTSTDLSSAAQSNCQTSGFVGAPAPTNDYDLDVNIDVGAFGLSSGGLLSVIQDVFIAPVWDALVWVVHALVVMLQWCYTLDLLGGPTMSDVARSVGEAQTSFTQPWLALVLAAASVLAIYNGFVRRRVTETLGQALLTIAMMALGLWVIADPLGTIGTVGQWANQASLGTLGAAAQGTTANAPKTLADSMRALFAGAIEMPWCYLEFGNVRWCSDPALFDSRLRNAASSIAFSQQSKLGCQQSLAHPVCREDVSALTVEHTSELVRDADTNGELFLAFPANGIERNSVKSKSSLLHVMCQSEDDTKCVGSTAAQAEFRSNSGTFPRMIGVVLIALGVLGMTMLFGLIAVHLLAAAVLSLFMLLLAPVAVLAPALGDGGRAIFTRWLTRLLGAVSSKLVFSFLLGALLTMQQMLTSLQPLGWWTQWLLISSFWWVVFLKRHQAIAFARNRGRGPVVPTRQALGRRIVGAREAKDAISHPVRWTKGKLLSSVPTQEQFHKRGHWGSGSPNRRASELVENADAQAGRAAGEMVSAGNQARHTDGPKPALGGVAAVPDSRRDPLRAQLERVRAAREGALARGDERRALRLAVRGRRIEAELAHEMHPQAGGLHPPRSRDASNRYSDRVLHSERPPPWATSGGVVSPRAAEPASAGQRGSAPNADSLESQLMHGSEQPVNASPSRSSALPSGPSALSSRSPTPPFGLSASASGSSASLPGLLASHDSLLTPTSSSSAPATDPRTRDRQVTRERRSIVMDDAREVAARRKRQLGLESPPKEEPIP